MIEYDYVKTRRADVRPIQDSRVPAVRFFMRWAAFKVGGATLYGIGSGHRMVQGATFEIRPPQPDSWSARACHHDHTGLIVFVTALISVTKALNERARQAVAEFGAVEGDQRYSLCDIQCELCVHGNLV
jgi:hypothetical protein